jgi:hypothetical protein
MAFVHGRNAGEPSTTEACEYWGGSAGCTCNGTNSAGYATSGWCGFAGGSSSTFNRVVIRYNATTAWYADDTSTGSICDVAAEINAIPDSDVRVIAHSAGNLVTLALLDDAANGYTEADGAGVAVRAGAVVGRRARAEHLGLGPELAVHLDADDRLVALEHGRRRGIARGTGRAAHRRPSVAYVAVRAHRDATTSMHDRHVIALLTRRAECPHDA